jgi:hypothetical protein
LCTGKVVENLKGKERAMVDFSIERLNECIRNLDDAIQALSQEQVMKSLRVHRTMETFNEKARLTNRRENPENQFIPLVENCRILEVF